MSKFGGKRVNVQYNRINEPTFLTKFKKQVGYKEDHGLSDKFAEMPIATTQDGEDREDEKPQIVTLEPGDLSEAEFKKITDETAAPLEKVPIAECYERNLSELKTNTGSEANNDWKCNYLLNPADIPLPQTVDSSASPIDIKEPPRVDTADNPLPLIPEAQLTGTPGKPLNAPTVPPISTSTAAKTGTNPVWWTEEIRLAVRNKKNASRKYQRSRRPCDLQKLKELTTTARRLIRRARWQEINEKE